MARYPGSNKMPLEKSILKLDEQKGFTLIEIIIASLILTLIVAAVVQYHSSAGVSKGQEYYLKAVQVARAELNKLRALYELNSGVSEFDSTGSPPADIFLFKFIDASGVTIPSPLFHVYYSDHSYEDEFLKPLREDSGDPPYSSGGQCSKVLQYRDCYENEYGTLSGTTDWRTFTYYTSDNNTITDENYSNGIVDASVVVIDDMGSPVDPEDDLIGNIGWWVEDVAISGTVYLKKVTFALQFWYPGQDWTEFDPEVIVLKTTLVKP